MTLTHAQEDKEDRAEAAPRSFVRFSLWQRFEHWLLVFSFVGLLATGLPQKYDDTDFSSWIIGVLGSVTTARFLHRIFALIFILESFLHMADISASILRRRFKPSMVVTPQDFRDAFNMLRYSVGMIQERPRFDRFDYKQKFEYWGIVLGTLIMVATGAALWYPTIVTRLLPGEIVPAAKQMHSGEALLAMLVVLLWHFYDVIFCPMVLPLDTTMITGKTSREKMMHEHPREYERLMMQLQRTANPVRAAQDDPPPALPAARAPPAGAE